MSYSYQKQLKNFKRIKSAFKWWKTSDFILSLCYLVSCLHPKSIVVYIWIARITRITRIHPCRHNCHEWPSAGEKSLKLINTPSHSPNDGQASPCLNSIPLIFLSSSLVPSYALYFLILSYTCTTIHRFPISFSVPESMGTCFSLSFSIQSWWNQPKFIHHSKLSPTISHHSLCVWNYPSRTWMFEKKLNLFKNYPLKTPSFPLYPNSIPIYSILYAFLWKPINQASGGVVDDMAIHSPQGLPEPSSLQGSTLGTSPVEHQDSDWVWIEQTVATLNCVRRDSCE